MRVTSPAISGSWIKAASLGLRASASLIQKRYTAKVKRMKIVPSEKEFLKMSKRGNVIPVYGQMQADLETPVGAFLKLDDGRFSYLLESVEGAEKVARFSFLGSQPRLLFTSAGR